MRIPTAVALCMMLVVLWSLVLLAPVPARAQAGTDEPFVVTAPTPFAGRPELTVLPGHRASVKLAAVSPDGKLLATVGTGDTAILLWDLTACRLLRTLERHQKEVTVLAFSPDSAWLASGDAGGVIILWVAADGQVEHTLSRHAERITALAFSPNAQWLASGSDDKTVTLWRAADGTVAQVLAEHTGAVSALAFSADSAKLASGGLDRRVVVWHAASGQAAPSLPDQKNPVAALAFHPAGATLAIASGPNMGGAERRFGTCEAALWNLAAGRADRTLPNIGSGYPVLAYAAGGKQIVTASSEKTLLLWDAATGAEQQNTVGQLPLPDLTRSLTWERDGVIKLWRLRDTQALVSFAGMDNGAAWVRATPQGYYDGSVGADAFAGWRFGANTYPCNRFAARFNKPALIAKVLAGESLAREPVLDGTALPPNVAIVTPKGDQELKNLLLDVTVQAAGMRPLAKLELTLIGTPVATNTVKTVTVDTPDTLKESFRLQLRLPISNTGFRLRAVVTDVDNMASAPAEVVLFSPGAQPFADKLHVLCVGVGQYRSPDIPPLRYAAVDAAAIAEVCRTSLGRAFTSVKVQTLVNDKATVPALQAALRGLRDAAGPNDVVVIYLATHRVRDAAGNPYLAAYDVDLNDLRRTALDWREVVNQLNGLRTQRVAVLAEIGRMGDNPATRGLDNQRWAFYAAKPDEAAIGRGDWGHSAFGLAVLEALRGKADTADPAGVVTFGELNSYVSRRVDELTEGRQHPQWAVLDKRVQDATLTWLLLPDLQGMTPEALTALLQSGDAEPARRDNVGRTLLHWATVGGQTALIDVLLARGADVNAADTAGVTPLHLAASLGAQAVAEKLLAKKADLNARDKEGRSAFEMARLYDHAPMMDFFLPAAPPDSRDDTGNTPLHLAVLYGRAGVVQTLLARNADVHVTNNNKHTPLHLAALEDQPEIAALLLGKGASLTAPDLTGATPLHLAVGKDRVKMVEFLLGRAAKINAVDLDKRTPLHWAALADNGAMIDLLAQRGAGLNLTDKDGNTPLLLAVKEKQAAAVTRLLARGVDVNARDLSLYTALHWAATMDTPDMAVLLLAAKANTNAHDNDGNTPLHVAAWYNNTALGERLIAAGARVNEKNNKGETPLKLATLNDSKLMIELLKKNGGFE